MWTESCSQLLKSLTVLIVVSSFPPNSLCARDRVVISTRRQSSSSSSSPVVTASLTPVNRSSGTGAGISSSEAVSPEYMLFFFGIVFPKNKLRVGSSLEAKLISLANVTKAEDFFRILGVKVPADLRPVDEDAPVDRTRQRPTRQSFVNQAACEPEMRTIDLSEYTHTSIDPDVAVFPRCIRVPRCGGCCGPSDLLTCQPTQVSIKSVTRVLQKLTVSSKDNKNTIQETVQVEYHESCACQCRVQERDCDPVRQVYHRDKCKCMCINGKEQFKCNTDINKIWNPVECSCKCRSVKRCSTGLRFSHDSCNCEIEH